MNKKMYKKPFIIVGEIEEDEALLASSSTMSFGDDASDGETGDAKDNSFFEDHDQPTHTSVWADDDE
jgi:hypothetical protein